MPQSTWVLLLTMSIPLLLQCTHLLMFTSSRITHHVTKFKSPQTGFLNMTMSSLYSNGLHSHQISIQQSTFGMWWNGRFASWMCSRQICSNCMMLSCQYGPKSLRNVSCFQHQQDNAGKYIYIYIFMKKCKHLVFAMLFNSNSSV